MRPVGSRPWHEFDTREGCLPYTFDDKSGAVTIADKAGTFSGGKLAIDGEDYIPLQIPEAGARFAFNEHRRYSFRGMCGMIFGCTTTQEHVSMAADGKFIWSRTSLTTAGDPGMGPWTAVGSHPPDQHGTYEVLAGGKIQLSYADGTVKLETFAVDRRAGFPRRKPASARRREASGSDSTGSPFAEAWTGRPPARGRAVVLPCDRADQTRLHSLLCGDRSTLRMAGDGYARGALATIAAAISAARRRSLRAAVRSRSNASTASSP